ncbi:MAG TPA: hypothetical protein VG899_11010 [Mycobacteriales bacterium]|nr:hypothetical protein [Mycobacteriales bacterium]
MAATPAPIFDFDVVALFEALDAQRRERGLNWTGVARDIWQMSHLLNAERGDHPISPATIIGMPKRGMTSCQHALFMLHWLDRVPESFLEGATSVRPDATLPRCGPDRRLRWSLKTLYAALDERRQAEALTWSQLAKILRCTPNQLTGLKAARFATNIVLAMRITQWLDEPAATFIRAARW